MVEAASTKLHWSDEEDAMPSEPATITRILEQVNAGDATAAGELMPLLYDDLRALAVHYFRRQGPGHTLQPTALVHEAYMRLVGGSGVEWTGRAHFIAVAAKAMRQILVNHARDKGAAKRGGGWQRVTLAEDVAPLAETPETDLLALDDSLTRLAALSDRQARVVELRMFGGLTIAETAHVLGVGTSTVENEWHFAKAWLARELSDPEPGDIR